MQYSIVSSEDSASITVFIEGHQPLVATSSHPNFNKIVEGALRNDESVVDLFDQTAIVSEKFEKLTERVSVSNGHVYFDGDPVDTGLTKQIVRHLDEGLDFDPLVNFLENLEQNPEEYSREQLWGWLNARDFTLTSDGMIVGYKSVYALTSEEGIEEFQSVMEGSALVNGEPQNGRIKQKLGDVVEMPRSQVAFDPSQACSTGLHVGTWDYADKFSGDTILEVHVNPRDVVSVPSDHSETKMRTCRYTIVDVAEKPYESALRYEDDYEYDDEHDEDFDDVDYGEPVAPFVNPADITLPHIELPLVQVGDVFVDQDARRKGNKFVVEALDGDVAIGRWKHSGLLRKIKVDRLLSRKYKRSGGKKK